MMTTGLTSFASSLITEVETGRGVALASPVFKHVSGKRLLYRPLVGINDVVSVGIEKIDGKGTW
jgi:hypothetical protein